MKIIAVSLFYKPIWPGFGTRFAQHVIDECTAIGNDVTLFTGRIPKEMQDNEKLKLKKVTENIEKGTIEINRIWTPALDHEGISKRIITYLIFVAQCFFKILFSRNVDLIIGLHPYPPFLISLMILTKIKKIKFVMTQADLWPDNIYELGIVKNSLAFSFIRKISIWAFNLIDIIIVITDELKDGMKKYPVNQSKIHVLKLAANTQIFKRIEQVTKFYNNKFVVMYSGIFSPNYDFDIILRSAALLSNKDILFVISGAGELKNHIKNGISTKKLSNIIMEEPVKDLNDLVQKLNNADILLLGMHDNNQANTAHPSKLFEFMACGKPILASAKGAVRKILNDSKAGIYVDPGDSTAFTEAIMKLYNSPEQRKILGENGLNYVKNFHSMQVFRQNLAKILEIN